MYVVELRIPAESVYKVHNMIKRMNPKKMEKDSEGNLKVVLEIPSGMQSEVYESLNRALAGQLQSKILEVKE
jgi:ribosome maturation protein Sdo1